MKTILIIFLVLLALLIGFIIGFFYDAIIYFGVQNEIINSVSNRMWFISLCL